MTVLEYKTLALSDKYKTPDHFDYKELERIYWKNVVYKPSLYGADVSGSITDKCVEVSVKFINYNLFYLKYVYLNKVNISLY